MKRMILGLVLILTAVSAVWADDPDFQAFEYEGDVYLYWFIDTYFDTDKELNEYTVQYRLVDAVDWTTEVVGFAGEYVVSGLAIGQTYEFQLLSLAPDGFETKYACANPVTIGSAVSSTGDSKSTGRAGLQTGDFDVEILKFQNIPYSGGRFNFLDVGVDSAGQSWPFLDSSHFEVYEDGVLQTENFAVVPPDTQCVRPADIVFLIDNSGSMGGEIAAVRNNAIAFGDSLAALGIDYRFGAVRFGQSASSGSPLFFGPLTDDVNVFRAWIATMYASGGIEPGLQAIINATSYFGFRPGSSRHFVLITDEDSDGGSLASAISLCNTNNITVHVRADCGYASSQIHYCGPNAIARQTGGTVSSVTAPFWDILDDLEEGICGNYVVRYTPVNDTCDGMEREVVVYAASGAHSDYDTTYYTPCMAPVITVTPDTRALELAGQLADVPLTIQAWVVDNVSPLVSSVTLHYRTTGGTGYTAVPMTNLHDSLWSYVVPGSGVQPHGLDYYITATDTESTASAPKVDPDISPYQIAVLPNEPPVIVHDTLGPTQPLNVDLPVDAVVTDTTLMLVRVELYFRRFGDLLFTMQPMTDLGGNAFAGTIPDVINVLGGCEYYILAEDDFGLVAHHGDADFPHQINVGTRPFGTVFGVVTSGGRTLHGVEMRLFDDTDHLVTTTSTDAVGYYIFEDVPNADYTVECTIPLGFAPVGDPMVAVTVMGNDNEVNFELSEALLSKFRHKWWWLTRFSELCDDISFSQYFTRQDVNDWCTLVFKHFYDRADSYALAVENATYMDDPPQPMTMDHICWLYFEAPEPDTREGRYQQYYEKYLLPLLLNFASNRMSQMQVVSTDGATVSQAITYFSSIYKSGSFDDARVAYYGIRDIHLGIMIAAGVIPPDIPNIMYRPEGDSELLPTQFALDQNYPNPFNPSTDISFTLPIAVNVRLEIINVAGQVVTTLVGGEEYPAGHHTVSWNGSGVATGVYLYRLEAGDFTDTKKMILLK
ncbi:MAG: T9SS type A sorting domain-containing protein [candidate division Zixibacteria bacterium]|nr:T9SS type A sorting domain-containing protein [candidate division Zixibacteria bacterium]